MSSRFVIPVRRVRLLAAVVGLMACSSRASAETITLYFDKMTNSPGVSNNLTAHAVTPGPYYWHQVGAPLNSNFPANVATFCVELTQGFPNPSAVYTVNPLAAKVDAATATAVTKLWGSYYDPAWENTSFTGTANSTAFQIALWELVYDGPGGALNTGSFRTIGANTPASTLAANWLAGLDGGSATVFASNFGTSQLVWLSNGSLQEQLTMIPQGPTAVPAPPSVVLAGFALATGLFGRAVRRRKEVADAVK